MKDELIERYIYAVISSIPAKNQPEVEQELESMIAELLEARCGDNKPGEEDIRTVLSELGPPEELAVKYTGEENSALLSGIYLVWYKKMLKLVLPIAALAVALALLLSEMISWQTPHEVNELVESSISTIFSGAFNAVLQAFAWVTIIFIIIERKKVVLGSEDFLSRLDPVPDKRAQIKLHAPVIGIMENIIIAVLILGFSRLIGFYTQNTGWVPVFNEAYIRTGWFLIVIWAACGVVCEVFKIIDRRYSKRLTVVTGITHVVTGICVALFFINKNVINPRFTEKAIMALDGEGGEAVAGILGQINIYLLIIILAALLLDFGMTFYRSTRYDKQYLR